MQNYDIIVIGGGMVGASLVAALKNHSDKKIAVIEAFEFSSDAQPSFDDRSIALSYGSRRIFESIGLWSELEPQIEAIKTIHVSDKGHLGSTRLHHSEENVEALGYVVENKVLGRLLMSEIQALNHVDWICPAKIQSLIQEDDSVSIEIEQAGQPRSLQTKLLVAADGVLSTTRQLADITTTQHDYQQSAIIANVQTDQKHNGIAFERFTDSGPVAFLPMTENRYSVVWTCKRDNADNLMALSDDEFIQQLQKRFGYRAGNIIKSGKRNVYPLIYTEADQLVKNRVVVIGNAAHTLHPVAGQGYNLALRDVAELAELIVSHNDPGEEALLGAYSEKRLKDMKRVYQVTDTLVKTFSNNNFVLGHARAAGLICVNLAAPLRNIMARQSMGLLGRMNKLQRRVAL